MNKKRFYKIIFFVASLLLVGSINANATEDFVDTIPPVFDSNIQTEYVVKKAEDGSKFIPEDVIKNITATDNVDGNDVAINLIQNPVDISSNGEYYVVYSATDKSGNESFLVVTVMVDGIAPEFDENTENLYYMNQFGTVFDSNYNVVEALPGTLVAKDSPGAYEGIGVCITTDEVGNIIFVSIIDNSPAVGVLEPNDILVGINGEDVRGQTPDYVASKIKGAEGTSVELQILRNNEEKSITIERQMVKLHEDEDCIAEANVEIDSIDTKMDGTVEIVYTVTDEAGNSSQFVIKVEIETTDPVINVDDKKENDDEKAYISNTTEDASDDKDNQEIIEETENDDDVDAENEEFEEDSEEIIDEEEETNSIEENEIEQENDSSEQENND